MRSTPDRVRQALSFEAIGLVIVTPLFAWLFDRPLAEIGVLSLVSATIATAWNYVFNLIFDHVLNHWRGTPRKTLRLRILHAIGFEASLVIILLPVFAWWLSLSLLDALVMDSSFALFYMGYTFVFTWAYDSIFPPEGTPAADTKNPG
ncbi:membrane protein [Marinicauda pacifica]|uniref:PACE efflux transporter n=1 Tax=Marinicauda pacifica TaxID=1133559 RepID=A0A4S2HFC0_9PROT|nr:PACE efflux transporter [Marinicauda pacifica]TGY94518.1 PACE efflux transporter [Marinicauda pacifica]GGE36506.1 membrane protein [Marinicauda pacifica]